MSTAPLQVVAGVLVRADGRVLIAERPAGKARAGSWEFPGGKRSPSESPRAALERELHEELGVTLLDAERLLVTSHRYPGEDRPVRIDCFRVLAWRGEPAGLDGQRLAWCEIARLPEAKLLAADRPIVTALELPRLFRHVADDAALGRLLAEPARERSAYLCAYLPAIALRERILARGATLALLDPVAELPPGARAVHSLAQEPLPAFAAQSGALVWDLEGARLAKAGGAAFVLARGSASDFGELSLPLYCARNAAGALFAGATGELLWPSGA